jgi:two-component system, NarL family, sensor kinase
MANGFASAGPGGSGSDEARYRQLEAREHAHARFAEQVISAQEAERRRLAADIHDGISQRLLSLSYHLDAAAAALDEKGGAGSLPFAAEQIALARQLVDLTLDEARAAIAGLRPPVLDDLGLTDALASLGRRTAAVPVSVEADYVDLPEHVEIALYRIAQEALQNVVKHSGASVALIEMRESASGVILSVTDDGAGFDVAAVVSAGPAEAGQAGDGEAGAAGFGLPSMAERAELVGGTLEIRSAPGRGTTVTAMVPVVRSCH